MCDTSWVLTGLAIGLLGLSVGALVTLAIHLVVGRLSPHNLPSDASSS